MQLTIVKADNLVLVDRQAQTFDLLGYSLPETLWALQWQETSGEIEYTDKNNEKIDALPDWTKPIIEEHKRLAEEQKLQQEQEERQNIYAINGQVHQQRIKRKQQQQAASELQKLKQQVAALTK